VTQFSDERGAELRDLFFETAQEMLQALNEEALKLEKHPGDAETVRSIRRTVHTLKGDAAACGFRELSDLAHELEDALASETAPSRVSLAEVAFTATDTFDALLAAYRSQMQLPSFEPLQKLVRELTQEQETHKPRQRQSRKAEVAEADWTEYEKVAIQNALSQGRHVYHVSVQLDPHCAMPIAACQLVLNALASVGEVLGERAESNLQTVKRLQWAVASNHAAEKVAAKCQIPTVISEVKIEEILGSLPPTQNASGPTTEDVDKITIACGIEASKPSSGRAEAENKPAPGATSAVENILRVDADRIDTVLNQVGELIIGKSMLQQVLAEFTRRYPKEPLRGRFVDALAFQARVLNDLQRSVMKVRMVPVEQLFRRFPRMLRDLAKQCGRDVELVLSGQDTDLDKGLLDAIAEPITHLVRNAVSHGIEDAETRVRAGKRARGTVRLDAYHQGNQVIVEVSDDGRGIDAQKVKAKAVEQKLVRPEEADALGESDILALVLRPGFSTAPEITEISGRGVGLDVVQSVLHKLKGTVEIVTRAGQGTTFRLKLPLTLAIIKALLFRVEQRLYAIPLNAVAEIARATEADLHEVDNREVLQMRDQVLHLVRLGRSRDRAPEASRAKIFVLVIALGARKLGLIVDGLEGEEELVIKAVDDQTVATDLVSGASILGDGRVVLILNLAAVIDRFGKLRSQADGRVPYGLLLSHADRVRLASTAEVRP
jgi:two-component system chemotaxis sensor kinase CheA